MINGLVAYFEKRQQGDCMDMIKTDYCIENTRNDSYVVMRKNDKSGLLISYAKNLCEKINEEYSLDLHYSATDLKNYDTFKSFVNELEEKGFCIYQLTRL